MNLKKALTILFALYGVLLLGALIMHSQFSPINDPVIWENALIINLIFIIIFYIFGLVMTHNFEKRIKAQDKTISELKGRLFDNIKDDEEREKMIQNFQKSLK